MAKQFYIKGKNNEWLQLTGREFYTFVNADENQNRYFYDFEEYVLEVSQAEFEKYNKEKNHADYLYQLCKPYQTMSIDSDLISEFGSGEETIANDDEDITERIFKSFRLEALNKALSQLDSEEYKLINDIYLQEQRKTEQKIADEKGLSQKAINKRKKKILKKLYFLVLKFEKSQQ